MSRDYKHAPKLKNKPDKGPFATALTFITGLSLGLFVALFFYLQQSDNSYLPFNLSFTKDKAESGGENPATKPVAPVVEANGPPAPKFDFYNILPNKEINISEWVAEDQLISGTETKDDNSVYILQVGSFKQFEAADQVKAQLALLGISADIQRVVINGQDTRYRVRIGPYLEKAKLNDELRRLQENNLEYMLLKLQADDPRVTDG